MQIKEIFGLILNAVLCAQYINGSDFDKNFIELSDNEEINEIVGKGLRRATDLTAIDQSLEQTYPNVMLVLINRQDVTQRTSFSLANTNQILANPWFSPRLPTVIYAFGLTEKITSPTTQSIIAAYAASGTHNMIIIDWSDYNGKNIADYSVAVGNMKAIGGLVGRRIYRTFSPLMIWRFHLVGHSLGAHMAAYINRAFPKLLLSIKIPKIVGLDPSGKLFYDNPLEHQPLNASDAAVVQVIHTDISAFGAPRRTGTIDFYPNGGGFNGIQPGCPIFDAANLDKVTNFCSHQRSVFLYAESITTKAVDAFKAIQCDSYVDFLFAQCGDDFDLMGFGSSDKYSGDFYLQTNSRSPFNRGISGISYVITAP